MRSTAPWKVQVANHGIADRRFESLLDPLRGIVKIEVVLNYLRFDNLWLSLEDNDTNAIEMI
jgi:hypothetical protein